MPLLQAAISLDGTPWGRRPLEGLSPVLMQLERLGLELGPSRRKYGWRSFGTEFYLGSDLHRRRRESISPYGTVQRSESGWRRESWQKFGQRTFATELHIGSDQHRRKRKSISPCWSEQLSESGQRRKSRRKIFRGANAQKVEKWYLCTYFSWSGGKIRTEFGIEPRCPAALVPNSRRCNGRQSTPVDVRYFWRRECTRSKVVQGERLRELCGAQV